LATVVRFNAIPGRGAHDLQSKYLDFLLYDNPQARQSQPIRTPLLAFFPTRDTRRLVVRLLRQRVIKEEGKAADFITATSKVAALRHAQIITTGAPALLENSTIPDGGMTTLALIAIGIMAVILLLLFRVRWRLLPSASSSSVSSGLRRRGLSRDTATIVTISGLPVMLVIASTTRSRCTRASKKKWSSSANPDQETRAISARRCSS